MKEEEVEFFSGLIKMNWYLARRDAIEIVCFITCFKDDNLRSSILYHLQ